MLQRTRISTWSYRCLSSPSLNADIRHGAAAAVNAEDRAAYQPRAAQPRPGATLWVGQKPVGQSQASCSEDVEGYEVAGFIGFWGPFGLRMKLKERLVAASLGFVTAIGFLTLWPVAMRTLRPEQPLEFDGGASAAAAGRPPPQRQLQKTEGNSGQSEQQTASEELPGWKQGLPQAVRYCHLIIITWFDTTFLCLLFCNTNLHTVHDVCATEIWVEIKVGLRSVRIKFTLIFKEWLVSSKCFEIDRHQPTMNWCLMLGSVNNFATQFWISHCCLFAKKCKWMHLLSSICLWKTTVTVFRKH